MEDIKKHVKSVGGFGKEFKDFIAKGNVIDLAVAVIIGAAFGAIVTSLVNDIIMPLIGTILGGLDFSGLVINIGNAHITYGNFIQSIVNFLVIAFCIFMIVKLVSKARKPVITEVEDKKAIEAEDEQLVVLKEIRDNLKK